MKKLQLCPTSLYMRKVLLSAGDGCGRQGIPPENCEEITDCGMCRGEYQNNEKEDNTFMEN